MIALRGLYALGIVALGAAGFLRHATVAPWAFAVYGAVALALAIGLSGRTNWPFPLLALLAVVGLSVPDALVVDWRGRFWATPGGERLVAHAVLALLCVVLVVEGAVRAGRARRTRKRLGLVK